MRKNNAPGREPPGRPGRLRRLFASSRTVTREDARPLKPPYPVRRSPPVRRRRLTRHLVGQRPRMRHSWTIVAAVLAVVLTLGLSACGGDDVDEAADTVAAEVEEAADEASEAIGDAKSAASAAVSTSNPSARSRAATALAITTSSRSPLHDASPSARE